MPITVRNTGGRDTNWRGPFGFKPKRVNGEGPIPARLMLIGEKPGVHESQVGRPFVGPSGQTLNTFLFAAAIQRDDIFVTNCVHEFTDWTKPTRKELLRDKPDLIAEILACNPEVLGLVGAYAVEWVLGREKADLDRTHGVPVHVDALFGGELERDGGWLCLPMYHPANVLHAPDMAPSVLDDCLRLGQLLDGEISVITNPITDPEYRNLKSPSQLLQIVEGHSRVAIDTEVASDGRTWSLQFSCAVGSGFMIRTDGSPRSKDLLNAFRGWLARERPIVILHNTLYDLSKLKQVGIDLVEMGLDFVDTMVWAYQLCVEPQSLKSLAYRHCALDMVEYAEVIGGIGYDIALDYLHKVMNREWPDCEPIIERDGGGEHIRQPQNIGKTVGRIIFDIANGKRNKKGEETDPRVRWKRIDREAKRPVVQVLGEMRVADLGDIEFDKAVEYACLAGPSPVLTEHGWMSIRNIVKSRYTGEVYGVDKGNCRLVSGRCTGWYKNRQKEPIRWLSVRSSHSTLGRWGTLAVRYTPDHRILTSNRGYVEVQKLKPNSDYIILPYERLTSRELQVVFGSVLGDGSLHRKNRGGWAYLSFSHCERQWRYLRWKASLIPSLEPVLSSPRPAHRIVIDGKEAMATPFRSVTTKMHPELIDLWLKAYGGRGRSCIGAWIEDLDWLGLAIFYQDDGTYVTDATARLYVCSYSEGEVDKIRVLLRDKFNLSTSKTLMHGRDGQWMIHILTESGPRFYEGIAPFMHPCMRYKLPLSIAERFPFDSTGGDDSHRGMCHALVTGVYESPTSKGRRGSVKTSYCIDVDGIHNFLTPWEVAHNCRDSDATLRIAPILEEKIAALELTETSRIDHDVLPMLDRMQEVGIKLAPEEFWNDIESRCFQQMDKAKFDIYKATGKDINPGSGDQVAELLYGPKTEGGLGLTPPMLTDGGKSGKRRGSTNDKCLENLLAATPVTQFVMDYREADKVRGTYVVPLRQRLLDGQERAHLTFGTPGEELPETDDPTFDWDRVRGTIRATRVPTGRLAIANPNLMAIPIRTELGKRIRYGFMASDGWVMYDADLSQIEARLFAHLCKDDRMCQVFRDDKDIHRMTASEMFSVPVNNIGKDDYRRSAAKQIIFGLLNGITEKGLVNQMILYRAVRPDGSRWTEDDCRQMIEAFFKIYPRAKQWQDECRTEAMATGMTREPIGGRVRFIPQIWASNRQIAEEAGRISFSHQIQGGAQSLMKIAMKTMWDALRELILYEKRVNPLLQVHDEILKEVRDDKETRTLVDTNVIYAMETAVKLRVPVKADGQFGSNWAEAH